MVKLSMELYRDDKVEAEIIKFGETNYLKVFLPKHLVWSDLHEGKVYCFNSKHSNAVDDKVVIDAIGFWAYLRLVYRGRKEEFTTENIIKWIHNKTIITTYIIPQLIKTMPYDDVKLFLLEINLGGVIAENGGIENVNLWDKNNKINSLLISEIELLKNKKTNNNEQLVINEKIDSGLTRIGSLEKLNEENKVEWNKYKVSQQELSIKKLQEAELSNLKTNKENTKLKNKVSQQELTIEGLKEQLERVEHENNEQIDNGRLRIEYLETQMINILEKLNPPVKKQCSFCIIPIAEKCGLCEALN
jgi:hypothetical protein